MLKQNHTKEIKLDVKNVILLDSCSTMDLFRNSEIVENITKVGKKMILQGNGGTLDVTHRATVCRYKHAVLFRKYSITNISAFKNFINQYWVTYDIIDKICVVHEDDKE